jgi:hypothetical protein
VKPITLVRVLQVNFTLVDKRFLGEMATVAPCPVAANVTVIVPDGALDDTVQPV